MPRNIVSIGLAAAGSCVCSPPPATAQIAEGGQAPVAMVGDTVVGRVRPGYSAIGVPLGGFRLYPSLDARTIYDSNIYALPDAPVEDPALVVSPRLALSSIEDRRYAVSLVADATITRYARQTIENNAAFGAVASGRVEVDRDTRITTVLTLARRVQRRGTEDESLVGILPPVTYRELSTAAAIERRFGPVVATVGGSVGQFRYRAARIAGVRVPLDDNDFEQGGLNGRVAVAIGPSIGAFASATYNSSKYATSTRLPSRDSSGYSLLGGLAFARPLIDGEVGLGYLRQSFVSPAYGDIRGFDYAAKLNWSPTQLVDIHFDVGRSFQRSALLGAAGIRLDKAAVNADYELLRNLLINVGLTYTDAAYRGLDRRERRIDNVFGVRYLANANLALTASVSAVQQHRASGSALGRDYDRARVSLGARLQL